MSIEFVTQAEKKLTALDAHGYVGLSRETIMLVPVVSYLPSSVHFVQCIVIRHESNITLTGNFNAKIRCVIIKEFTLDIAGDKRRRERNFPTGKTCLELGE